MMMAGAARLWRALWVALFALACGPGVADFTRDLGDGYSFVSTGPFQKYVLFGDDYAVRNLVVDLAHDDRFIVGLRLVAEEYECQPGPTLSTMITPAVEYWLVEKSSGEVHGPLSRRAFDEERERLGVPAGLQLDSTRAQESLARFSNPSLESKVESGVCRPFDSGAP